jgi:hypothetical protein
MYVVLESAVCVLLVLGVATCLFGLCVVFLLFQEGHWRLRHFVDRSMNFPRPLALKTFMLRPAPATWVEEPANRNISNLAT